MEGNVLYAKLKCMLCGKRLSVEPVSESDGQYTCGRCRPNSCIFNGCEAKLKWGEVKAHEKICDFREVSCPFSDCFDRFQLSSFQSHVENAHTLDKIQYRSDELNLESLGPSAKHVNLRCISYGGLTFLVFIKISEASYYGNVKEEYEKPWGHCSLGVFFIGTELHLPDITFEFVVDMGSNVTSTKTINCNGITKYTETTHCLSCLSKVCLKPDHKNIGDTFLQGVLRFSNHSKLFSYVVKFHEKTCMKALPNFECPVCREEFGFDDPIYLCPTGHSLCSGCRKRLYICSFCRSPFQYNLRNFTLEQIIREHGHATVSE